MTKCPKSLHYLQTLAVLPNVLNINAPWPVLDIQTVADKCGVHMECFSSSRPFLAQALANSSEFSLLCAEVLKYRLEKKQDCCTALRSISSWNVSGWRTLQWTNSKTQAILRRARKGIVCLQETRWTASTATSFLQTYPGFNLAATPAIVTENGGLSDGVAILIPCTFRLLRDVVVTPGKIIAAQVQTRTDRFWIVSVYCHPSSAKSDCEKLAGWLTEHQDESDPFFIIGDFNHSNTLARDAWQRLLDAAKREDIIHDEPTFWGPNGSSSLDKAILPTEYMNRGLIQHQVFYDRLFESSGHACISIQLRHRPPVSSSPDLPTHMIIPASVFQPGKDRHDTRSLAFLASSGPPTLFSRTTHVRISANTAMAMVDVSPTKVPRLQHPTETPPDWPTAPHHFKTIVTRVASSTSRIQAIPWRILSITHHDYGSSDLPLEVFRGSWSPTTTTTPHHQK